MVKSDYKQILFNLIWGIIGGFLSYFVNFLLTPYITNNVGIEAYGFVSLGNTLISYINIIAIGLNSFVARFVAVHYHNEEYDEASAVYSSVLIANMILSFAVVIICIPIIYELDTLLTIPVDILLDVKLLFLFVILTYLINLFVGVISTVAFINNITRITSRIKAFASIIYTISIFLLFNICGINIAYVGLANFIATLICLGLVYKTSVDLDDKIRFDPKKWSTKKIKTIINAGIFNSINSLGGTLGSGLDLLITNKYLNVMTMGQIAVSNQLGTLVTMAVSLVSNVFQPKQLEAYSKKDVIGLIGQLKNSMRVCGFIGFSFLILFISIGNDFLALWIPDQDIERLYYITIIILVGNAMISVITPLYYISTLTVKMKPVCVITVICGIINLVLMLILIPCKMEWGGYIVVGTTTLLNVVALVLFPRLCEIYLNLQSNPFWAVIAKFLLVMTVYSGIAVLTSDIVCASDWTTLIVYMFIIECFVLLGYAFCMFGTDACKEISVRIINRIKRSNLNVF